MENYEFGLCGEEDTEESTGVAVVEVSNVPISDPSIASALGVSENALLASKTYSWSGERLLKLKNGTPAARIEPGMKITLVRVVDRNRNRTNYWFTIDTNVTSLNDWRSHEGELGGGSKGPSDWKIRFLDSDDGPLDFYLVDTILGRDQGSWYGFRHFCDWDKHSITPRIDLTRIDWYDDCAGASRQFLGGWSQKCS